MNRSSHPIQEPSCTQPDQFGGHAKPFVLIGELYRLCVACGRADDNSGDFAVRREDVATFDVVHIEAAAQRHGVALVWADRCPTCDSTAPHLHPAVQNEGEVQPCRDAFHERVTPQNTPEQIAAEHPDVGWYEAQARVALGEEILRRARRGAKTVEFSELTSWFDAIEKARERDAQEAKERRAGSAS